MALPTINNQREDSSLGVTTRKFKTTRSGLNIPPVIDNQRKANLWMWPQRNLRPHGVAWTYHLSFITRGRANLWMWPQKFKNTRGGFPGYEIGASCILFQYVTWSGTRLAHLAYYFNFHLSFGDILRKSQGPHTVCDTNGGRGALLEKMGFLRVWSSFLDRYSSRLKKRISCYSITSLFLSPTYLLLPHDMSGRSRILYHLLQFLLPPSVVIGWRRSHYHLWCKDAVLVSWSRYYPPHLRRTRQLLAIIKHLAFKRDLSFLNVSGAWLLLTCS